MRLPLSHRHRQTPCITPKSPKSVAQNDNFYNFCVAFHVFVAGNCSHFKLSQPTHDKLSLKLVWSHHMTHFKVGV